MWNPNIRPHGECFALNQAVTAAQVAGNQVNNNPMRLDQSQGGTAIRVVVPREAGKSLTVAKDASIILTVAGRKIEGGTTVALGTAVYTNDTGGAIILNSDALVCEFVLPQNTLKYPYISVTIGGSVAATGTVDIFPHYISSPRRG